tara:strand:- start:1301 stop:1927 length:627 start_codon:yes stop_codon:yes gene_type:complete
MKNKIEYFFDCSSPWTYLAFKGITDLSKKKDFELIWKPILVGGIFNTTNPSVYEARNNPNPVKEKLKYYFEDLKDWCRFRDIIINHDGFGGSFSPKVFPVNSVKAMRGAFMFIDEGGIENYVNSIFYAYWTDGLDISLEENLIKIIENLDINPNKFLNFIKQQGTKDRLKDNTQELVDRGGFGSPTFFLNENKMYFGQDRILLIESQL